MRRWPAPAHPGGAEPEQAPGPEEAYIAREELRRVRALADALPEKLRTITALYYGMDMPVKRIAALLHLPAGTVKSRLHRARTMIEEGLKHDE